MTKVVCVPHPCQWAWLCVDRADAAAKPAGASLPPPSMARLAFALLVRCSTITAASVLMRLLITIIHFSSPISPLITVRIRRERGILETQAHDTVSPFSMGVTGKACFLPDGAGVQRLDRVRRIPFTISPWPCVLACPRAGGRVLRLVQRRLFWASVSAGVCAGSASAVSACLVLRLRWRGAPYRLELRDGNA